MLKVFTHAIKILFAKWPTANVAFFLLLIGSCQSTSKQLTANHAMVVSARHEASNIGVEVMKKGGNAFDAFFAVQLALSVAHPNAGNVGGGGFMVYRLANGETGTLDFREKAPMAAHKDMYLDAHGEVIPNSSTLGVLAVGVPGSVDGIYTAHNRFGSIPTHALIEEVIQLAAKGVVVTQKQAESLANLVDVSTAINGVHSKFSKPYKEGDTIQYPAFVNTLKLLQKGGRDAFYKGELAKKMIEFLKSHGGIITLKDLDKYKSVWRKAIEFEYKGHKIISMPPPSSGGVCLAQMLKMTEKFEINRWKHHSLEHIQLLTEIERRSFADRNHFLGDPDFIEMPIEGMLHQSYLDKRMENFTLKEATPSSMVAHGNPIQLIESNETTHFSIVDPFGNAVAVTTTLNGNYGSKLFDDNLGFFYNNEMDDFSVKIGVPNMFGLTGTTANAIAPEKRMLSSMTPTIVEKNQELFLVLGTPGGSTIITSVLQTILNVIDFEMDIEQAVSSPRFHHQWLPDQILFEPEKFDPKLFEKLRLKGYKINEGKAQIIGKVDAIMRTPSGQYKSGADPRGDDSAAGF